MPPDAGVTRAIREVMNRGWGDLQKLCHYVEG